MLPKIDGEVQRIKFAREAAEVKRCHTMHILGEYKVGLHVHNMLSMLRILYPDASTDLIWAIHEHDLAERLTGDIPAPSKWAGNVDIDVLLQYEGRINNAVYGSDSIQKLTNLERDWLKGLDMLELFCWTKDQLVMGNSTVQGMKDRIWLFFKTHQQRFPLPIVDAFYIIDKDEWKLMPEFGDKHDSE